MAFTGAGFTPGGEVELLVLRARPVVLGSYETTADAAGAISGSSVTARRTQLLARRARTARAPRCHGQRPHAHRRRAPTARVPVRRVASSRSRAGTASRPAATSPGRKVEVEAYGWAFAAGKPLYFLLPGKGGTTVASVERRRR